MTQDPRPSREPISGPRGTRDLYPAEAARRRWLMERWREVSIRHGFEEVDGPTFEESDLYAVKSGEGILGELFQAFSGKSPEEVEQVKQTAQEASERVAKITMGLEMWEPTMMEDQAAANWGLYY